MSHGSLKSLLAVGVAGLAVMLAGCKKKEAPAVIEEVPPAATAAPETDTSATLAEEPALKQVGKEPKDVKGAKATFHPSASADKAGFSDQGHFVVQVSVFKSKHQAASLVEKLANQGYPAYVAEVENPTPQLSGTWHRVRIGKFMHIADAKSFGMNTLKPMGYDFWVDNKKNDKVGGEGGGATSEAPAPAAEPKHKKSRAAKGAPAPSAPAEPVVSEPAQPAEPAAPPAPAGDSWGNPKAEEQSAPPPAPAGDSWGNPKADEPKTADAPKAKTEPAAPAPAAAAPSAAPAGKAPGDTGKVNLDEW